jgi:hypothetical protein
MFASTTHSTRRTVEVPSISGSSTTDRVALALAASFGAIVVAFVAPGVALVAALIGILVLLAAASGGSIVAFGDPAATANGRLHVAAPFANFTR